jgi:GntR family transcriptional repressor for pyruvate dehydrogenase complex
MNVTSQPAYQQVAEAIRGEILAGQLAPGARIPAEGEFAGEHGVSRSTIREALRILSSQNLVITTRGVTGGTLVAVPETSQLADTPAMFLAMLTMAQQVDIGDMLEARETLEVPAARLAAVRGSEE